MKILAIDTATEACSAALHVDGIVEERYRIAPREHNRLILRMIDELLDEAGLSVGAIDAVAFGRGPGSFTGVRIAAAVAQGIAFGAGLPVIPVSTLAALAAEALDELAADWAHACIDARMGEVYVASYRRGHGGLPVLVGSESVLRPDDVVLSGRRPAVGIGSGWASYGTVMTRTGAPPDWVLPDRFPRASLIVRLGVEEFRQGRVLPAELALPNYLRDEVAKKKAPSDAR